MPEKHHAINIIQGLVIPLPMDNVDTDMIIPAQYLMSTKRKGYGQFLFKRLIENDRQFVFNQKQYLSANILLTKANFGCGSSREHAVWALQERGISAIIAESYSDIFYNNALKNGLLALVLPKTTIDLFFTLTADNKLKAVVDTNRQLVQFNDLSYPFAIDPFRKNCLLNGFDDLDYLLSHHSDIKSFFQRNSS